tara:strand:+ start:133 stop:405 length:273 start_codon:yes stop_codon:yes gene_type:complete
MEDFITTEYNLELKNLEKELKMKQMRTSSGTGVVDPTFAVGSDRLGGTSVAQQQVSLTTQSPVATGTPSPSFTSAVVAPLGGGSGGGGSY